MKLDILKAKEITKKQQQSIKGGVRGCNTNRDCWFRLPDGEMIREGLCVSYSQNEGYCEY